MKTRFSFSRVVSCFVALFILSMGQLIYAAPSHKQLTKRVEDVISRYYPQEFGIKVSDTGTVRIRGDVNALYDRLRIFDIVSAIRGVQEIENEIVVHSPMLADKAIEASLIEKFRIGNTISEPERISTKVDNGIVFLSGEVNFYRDKLVVNTIASWEPGVKGIEDQIKVVPHPASDRNDLMLEAILLDILQYQFPDENGISLSVQDGVVTLDGTTRTMWRESQVVKELSSIIGVKEVISDLKLNG